MSPARTGPGSIASTNPGPRRPATTGRHPRDLVALLAATGVVALCSLPARMPATNPVEIAVFEQVQRIPTVTGVVWQALAFAGGWAGLAVVTGIAVYLKKIRIGLLCAASGVLAGMLALGLGALLGPRPVDPDLHAIAGVRLPDAAGFTFPSYHAAIAAAVVAVAAPYIGSGYRWAVWTAWTVVALVATAGVYLGTALPLDAVAGVFLGWGVGAAFHLVWGAPGRRTSRLAVRQALEDAGLEPTALVPIRTRMTGPVEFSVTTADGTRLRAEVVRRLHRRAGPVYRLRRMVASVEIEDEPALSGTHHEAEHEALVTMFAQRAGLRTPPLVLTCQTRHGSPVLVRREIDGRRLTELGPEEVDDRLLDAFWAQIAVLGDARIAHHDLRATNVLVDADGEPWLLNLTFGKVGASTARIAQDLAEALVSVAALVGVERTVAGACKVLSPDRLEPALAYLQPLALPRRIRKQAADERYLLTDLRETLSEHIRRPIPPLRSPLRLSTVIGLLALGAAVYVLLPQLSGIGVVTASLRYANWAWLAVTLVAGLLAIVASAVSVQGSSPVALPFWPTTWVQLAAAFTGRTTPGGVGFFGVNIAFLERRGLRRASAVGVTALNVAGTAVVGGIWCVVGVLGVGVTGEGGIAIPHGPLVVAGGAVVLVAVVAVAASPFGRRRVVRPALRVARELRSTLRRPVRATQLFGGASVHLLVSGLGLATSLAAFGESVPLFGVLAVFVVAQTLGHVVPVPGGLGPVEAFMIGGLSALGVAATPAVAAVLTCRLLTYWLPVLPGIVAFRYLQHRRVV